MISRAHPDSSMLNRHAYAWPHGSPSLSVLTYDLTHRLMTRQSLNRVLAYLSMLLFQNLALMAVLTESV